MTLKQEYEARFEEVLKPLAISVEGHLRECLEGVSRIDRISARPKGISKFLKKAANKGADGQPKYDAPLEQIQDQVGARVVVFYKSDVEIVSQGLLRYLRPTEDKALVPQSEWEFGYFGRHIVCLFPNELLDPAWPSEHVPRFFELQVKTLFQHAWSEANHDVGYKPEAGNLTPDQLRNLAFASAQAWGADRAFDELFQQLSAASAV